MMQVAHCMLSIMHAKQWWCRRVVHPSDAVPMICAKWRLAPDAPETTAMGTALVQASGAIIQR